jgi:CPA2 family monovalent cation:H+ antiporter-2
LANAGTLILTSAGMTSTPEVIRLAREMNPGIRVLVRAAYLRDAPELQRSGADLVFTGEGEVALALTEAILRRLGATPDQIDRERARVHSELLSARDESSAVTPPATPV